MKLRITIGIVILTSLVMLLGMGLSIPRFISIEHASLIENENIILAEMQERAREAIITRQFSDLQDMVTNTMQYSRVRDVIITNHEGIVVASNISDLLGETSPKLGESNELVWRKRELVNQSGPVGVIHVHFSYQEFNKATSTLWSNALVSAVAGITVIAFIAWLYANALTRNLGKLVEAARSLANGDFNVEVSVSGERELTSLAASFSSMAKELKQTFRTLQTSEQRYKLAAAGTNDGIWEWNIQTDEIYISPRWKSILGYEANESIESSDYWFNHVIPEDVDALKSAFFSHIEGEFDHIEIEFRMLDATSQVVWVSCRGLIQRDKRGKAVKLAGSISDITGRKNAENILQQQAMYDGLTGLPNRHLFVDRLNQALAHQRRDSDNKLAVLFIDLDRFKTINDSLGHAAGDRLLVEMSRRFTRIVREIDTLARFGGDEFVLLLNHTDDENRPEKVAKRLCEDAKRGFDISGQTVFVSASIGMVNIDADIHDAESALRDADVAMYKAKSKGGDCFRLFDRSMHMDAVSQLQIATDLQEALLHDQLVLYYQPILDLKSGKWSGMEALIRWNHPVRGLMSPVDFIPFAEQSGLINEIGQWVMVEAVRQLAVWTGMSDAFKDLTMSINVSVKQIDGELVKSVMQAVEAHGVSPSQIQLEITESLVMSDFKQVINISHELKAAGIRLAMDDFGTGYSSLSYLHRLPFSALKIDRSFISVMKTRKSSDDDIVAAVIRLANNFNMKVVAEGVENNSQLQALNELGCDYVQGYFIGKPKPASEIEAIIAEGKIFLDLTSSMDTTVVSIT